MHSQILRYHVTKNDVNLESNYSRHNHYEVSSSNKVLNTVIWKLM